MSFVYSKMITMLIDTHTHLFSEQFNEDRHTVVESAIAQGVEQMYLPNISVETLPKMQALANDFPSNCFSMAGLHPCDVKENFKEDLAEIYKWITEHREQVYGIGETGLDYYWETTFVKEQKESLHTHAEWAKEFDLPIILHTRDSFEDNLRIMRTQQNGNLKGIFHCFTGTLEEAKQVIDLGFLLGIGGVITFKNSGEDLRKVIEEIPLQHIVLETDSPYLAPHPNRGKRNDSSLLPLIAQKIADTKDISFNEVAETTTKNALKLFKQ